MTGPELRAARIAAGLTQSDLALRLGMDGASISLWESGKRKIHPLKVLAIEAALRDKPITVN